MGGLLVPPFAAASEGAYWGAFGLILLGGVIAYIGSENHTAGNQATQAAAVIGVLILVGGIVWFIS
jgi:hypothetical protein